MTLAVGVDWSGAVDPNEQRRRIWLATSAGELSCGRTREQLVDELCRLADGASGGLVAALDFSFGFPAWFLDEMGAVASPELWDVTEQWLTACDPPFWGRPGKRCEVRPDRRLRASEAMLRPAPKSIFQIGGAGAVGTGALRGMPMLRRLRDRGFAVWPFDTIDAGPPGRPVLVEGWPRLCAPHVRRSTLEHPDAFDAWILQYALAATWTGTLPAVSEVERREGRIWSPWT